MKCPFCDTMIPDEAPCCPECGYRTVPAPVPTGKLELTDEQIMAFAGFQTAQRELSSSQRLAAEGGDAAKKKILKLVLFITLGILPLLPALFKMMSHGPNGETGFEGAAKMIQGRQSDSQTAQIDKDLADDAKAPTH